MATVTTRDNRLVVSKSSDLPPLQVNPLLERMAFLLDECIQIPGTSRRIGLDGIIGLIPGIGDVVTLLSAAVLLQEAKRLGLSRWQRARIMGYHTLDAVLGVIPILGDLFDFAYKANVKSLRLLQQHAEKVNRERGIPQP